MDHKCLIYSIVTTNLVLLHFVWYWYRALFSEIGFSSKWCCSLPTPCSHINQILWLWKEIVACIGNKNSTSTFWSCMNENTTNANNHLDKNVCQMNVPLQRTQYTIFQILHWFFIVSLIRSNQFRSINIHIAPENAVRFQKCKQQ